MTAQISDTIIYNGETVSLHSEPLEPFLESLGDSKPMPNNVCTGCYRGYIAKWEIDENKLYLTDIEGYPENNNLFTLENLFQSQSKVFAEWFTGELRIPKGKMLNYEHLGYLSIYEKDLFFDIEKGMVISTIEVDNTGTFNADDPFGLDKAYLEDPDLNNG